MTRQLTCIICPIGCSLTAEVNGEAINITGNTCEKGKNYAINECTCPTRTLTSTVRVSNREDTMVSVKSASPVPKDSIFDLMRLIRSAAVTAPIKSGDTILTTLDTKIIATKSID